MSDLNFLDTSGNKQTITVPATNSMAFNTANTERLRIDPSGRLLIGTQSTSDNAFLVVKGNVTGSGQQGEVLLLNGANPIEQNYGLGQITFGGGTGDQVSSKIQGFADHDWNTGGDSTDSPGRIVFFTTPDGSATPTEKLRISSEGFVTKPHHPSFRATREGSEITHSAQAIQQWNTVSGANRSFDRYTTGGYGFNTSTHKYKVPVTGVWYFHAAVYTNTGYSCMFDIRTSSQLLQRAEDNSGSNMPNNNIVHASCVVTCNKDDEVYVNQSGGQGKLIAGQGYISFDGHFIG